MFDRHPHPSRAARPRIHAVPQDGYEQDPPQRGAAARAHRQNGMGDVVLPAEHGEVVALPRLWDFGLERVDGDAALLRSDTGLIAVVTLLPDTAVVDGVDDGAGAREIA